MQTGLPKGVEITHYNIVANGVGVVALNQLHPEYEARNRNAAALCFLPMYHAFSQGYFITSLPYERIPIYIMQKFDLVKMLSHVQNFHITKLMAVPPVLVLMTKHPLAQQADLSSLDMLGSGAAPLAVDTQKEINRLLNREDTKLRQGWGMTEVTCTAIAWDPNRPSSPGVGELMPNCKARLVDPTTGQDITEAMVPGELWISGPNVMRGYWHNPSATREAFVLDEGGTEWLRTGDVAYVEEYATGTLFHIVDRFKELIKVNGHQVAPAELEALLVERNDVIDAAVVGAVVGTEELPRAYIVRRPGATTSEDEISSWLAERVVRYKWLSGGVVFTNAIPKNPVRF
jgi:acyl-CoA synthetase (AMP-forming)/AMP-acid ligase II